MKHLANHFVKYAFCMIAPKFYVIIKVSVENKIYLYMAL